ncbi:flavin-containing monooxygenase [Aspergillus chevalieri]|uniref:FAD/NAD(P)-binding domain-containing protein n=1 Tax=Aspergillus chevalieri TaxID=182096 RepID=A0A7R7ZSI7_ASPCH|nr:uncharacterized protein ACHE_70285A [Aspergillus chevalieri]BCR91442.1 hypothetical protein ACHE_70285A [Aspergillus chevalieri]
MDGKKYLQTDALVIGGGFSGCCALHKLRQQGLTTKLLEAGGDFGGVWYWNRYPGARVDTEMPMYQFNFPEVYKDWNWSERFPAHDELRRYFQHVDRVLDLRRDAIFNTVVSEVTYDEGERMWCVKAEDGMQAACRYLIVATGSSYKAFYPSFPGLEAYNGHLVHSARYPQSLEVTGKKVGIVGNGASGLQIVQELAKQDCEMTVFIRTPGFSIPMRQRKFSPAESESQKGFYDAIFSKCYNSTTGFANNTRNQSGHDATPEEREALFDELWQRGGFNWLISNYSDYLVDERVNSMLYDYWARQVRARMTDPVKMDFVAPLKQEQLIATKRPSLEQDYYEMIDKPNVHLHSLKEAPIVRLDANGIVTRNVAGDDEHHHDLDVIIFATGYDAVTGSQLDLSIQGRDQISLGQKWKDGTLTHLGMMVPGMPNLFLLYGPQAPTSLANGPPFIEMQVDWISKMTSKMKERGVESIEPTQAAAEQWREHVLVASTYTLLPKADSWYMGANIPGKRREPLIYMGGLDRWWQMCMKTLETWEGLKTG